MAHDTAESMYPVGKELVDVQHKVLLDCLSSVCDLLRAGKPTKQCYGALENLDVYCQLHFQDEERIMEELGIDELPDHVTLHALFLRDLELVIGECSETGNGDGLERIMTLKDLFLEHVTDFDKRYLEHCRFIASGTEGRRLRQ
jgi:hemerythrin-like metal-binding protein